MVKILSFLSLFLALSFSSAWGATYYVDYTGGSDANTGTFTSAAFKHSPGDNNATNTAASTNLAAGDTVIFKGAVRYKGIIDIDWSGGAGSPITYDGNSAGTWGTGDAVIDNLNDEAYAFYAPSARNYITIKNFEIVDVGGYTDDDPIYSQDCSSPVSNARGGQAISFSSGGSYLILENLYIHEVGQWKNQPPFEGIHAVSGSGIRLNDTSNVIIRNIEFTRLQNAIRIGTTTTSSDIDMSNLDLSHFVWGIDVNVRATNAINQNIHIHDSIIHDYFDYDDSNWAGCGSDNPHSDGLFIRTDYDSATWTNINLYNNKFYSLTTSGGGTSNIYISKGATVNIYNNTFTNTLHGRTIFINGGPKTGGSAQTVKIYSNTFYNPRTAIGLASQYGSALGDVYIKNNIFYDTRAKYGNVAIFIEDTDSVPNEVDYNIYQTSELENNIIRADGTFGTATFAEVQAYGWEANGYQADPKFVDISYGMGANSNLNNLHLQSDSPAKDTGAHLGADYVTDIDGQTRPQGLGWDMGAYEYEAVTPSPPTDLR